MAGMSREHGTGFETEKRAIIFYVTNSDQNIHPPQILVPLYSSIYRRACRRTVSGKSKEHIPLRSIRYTVFRHFFNNLAENHKTQAAEIKEKVEK